MRRFVLSSLLALGLVACGDPSTMLADAKKTATEAVSQSLDTKTMCTLAGKPEAFCGCVQDAIGPTIKPEHVDAVGALMRETLAGGDLQAAAARIDGLDKPTRDAFVQCAVNSGVDAAVEEAQGG